MLSPKRVKRRKVQRGNMPGNATRCNSVVFGEYALVAMGRMWITNRQIEAARIALNRHIKRGGKIWIRIFPDKPYSKKPAETRMGKGKGAPEYWVAVVKPGTVMFELGGGVDKKIAEEAMVLAGAKLPIKTKFVARSDMEIGA
ncbi:50S ribosomal protein L16 [Spirochaetia bacterium]|nr:50S ribosomal protein L16 [Spirochaetia bacterium]